MAVAKCVTVSGRSRGQLSTYLQRREAVWPSFCARAELERWTAAGPLARKRRRALVERLLAHAKGHAGPAASASHRGGTLTGSLGGCVPSARWRRPAAACQRARTRRASGWPLEPPNRDRKKDTHRRTESNTTQRNNAPRTQARAARRGRARARRARRAGPATQLAAFDASQMEGAETFGFWDPFGFSDVAGGPDVVPCRRAQARPRGHGRVHGFYCAVLPAHEDGRRAPRQSVALPGLSTVDVTFGDLAAAGNPVEQFKLIPTLGLWQFAFVAGMIETYGEFQKPHYLRGGAIGRNTLIWDPVGQLIRGEPITDTLAEDVRAKKRERELANGRLAMIGAMGFSAHYMIEGSVPAVIGNY